MAAPPGSIQYYIQSMTSNQGGSANGGYNLGNIQPTYTPQQINDASAYNVNPIAQGIASAIVNEGVNPSDTARLQQIAQTIYSQLAPGAQQQWSSYMADPSNFSGGNVGAPSAPPTPYTPPAGGEQFQVPNGAYGGGNTSGLPPGQGVSLATLSGSPTVRGGGTTSTQASTQAPTGLRTAPAGSPPPSGSPPTVRDANFTEPRTLTPYDGTPNQNGYGAPPSGGAVNDPSQPGASFTPAAGSGLTGYGSVSSDPLSGGGAIGSTPVGSGGNVSDQMKSMMITNPDNLNIDVGSFMTPYLNDQLKQNNDLIQNSAAARGGLQSGSTLKELSQADSGILNSAYQTAVGNAMADRDTRLGQNNADRAFQYNALTGDRTYNTGLAEYNQNFGYNAANNDRQYQTALDQYNQGFGYNAASADRQYQTGLAQYNQGFGYNAAVGDRQFNYMTLQQLANMGMQGTQGNAQLNAQLAALLSANGLAGAQATGAATVGGANSINQTVSSIINQIISNNLVNRLPGLRPDTGGGG